MRYKHLRYKHVPPGRDFSNVGIGYNEGVDAVMDYTGSLHPETSLEDILKGLDDAIETGVI